jgi:hypothetical protein
MARYLHPKTALSRCVDHAMHADSVGTALRGNEQVYVMGAEGSGHHAFNSLQACGPERNSTCWNRSWKLSADEILRLSAQDAQCKETLALAANDDAKFIVLLRDPVDTFGSYLRRFWLAPGLGGVVAAGTGERKNVSIAQLLSEHHAGWAQMSACASALPCDRVLVIAFELLLAYPWQHQHHLAAFLGVGVEHKGLVRWLASLHEASQAPLLNWVLYPEKRPLGSPPPCVYAGKSDHALMAKLAAHADWMHAQMNAHEWEPWQLEHCRGPGARLSVGCFAAWRDATRAWLYARPLDAFPAHPMRPCLRSSWEPDVTDEVREH